MHLLNPAARPLPANVPPENHLAPIRTASAGRAKSKGILATGLLAAGVALLSPAAHAAQNTYAVGDLLLGFEQAGAANDYVVDIGPVSLYLGATPGQSYNITTGALGNTALGNISADLANATNGFGSSWANNDPSVNPNLLNWGIVGASNKLSSGPFGLPASTLFFTQAEAINGVPTNGTSPLFESSTSIQTGINANIVSFAGTFNRSNETANSTVATFQSSSLSNGWTGEAPSNNGFTSGLDIEQGSSGTNIGPTNSVLDLYELQPATGTTTPGSYLGNFSLSSSGALTYTAAVPEPSSFVAIASGLAMLLVRRRRFRGLPA